MLLVEYTCVGVRAYVRTCVRVVGEYMKDKIVQHMKKKNLQASIKYIDPSYMIRSVPANAADALCVPLMTFQFLLVVSAFNALPFLFSSRLCLLFAYHHSSSLLAIVGIACC